MRVKNGFLVFIVVLLLIAGCNNLSGNDSQKPAARTSASAVEPSPTDSLDSFDFETESPAPLLGTGMLENLNSVGYSEWYSDSVQRVGGVDPIEVISGDDAEDDSTCTVWVFKNKKSAQKASKDTFFGISQFWVGVDDQGFGVILQAESADDNCAIDAADALNWNLY